jgi:predicted dehydrogenase
MSSKKRYAQVGLGGRSGMFRDAVFETFPEICEMVSFCDINPGRVELAATQAKEKGFNVPTYAAEDFDRMIAETKPDCVIVTTKDCHHDDYICRAMELGCDVVTEKPMTTDDEKCRRIIETQERTGKTVTVTFNYRYAPPRTQIKDMLMSGVVGEVLSIDFHWMLNTSHGADYYRRWHRNKVNSGGLMVHKSTHHFDLVNWWLSSVPKRVFASGQRKFYTPETGDRYGLTNRGERCLDCPEKSRCKFVLNLNSEKGAHKGLYLDCEKHDGYFRDRCVFSGDIDIEDTMNVLVDYQCGARMCYSLNSFSPWEGYVVVFNGTKGRIEHKCEESVYVNGDGTVPGALQKEGTWTRVFPHWEPCYEVDVWQGEGGHGGADPVMLSYIFDPENQSADTYLRAADQRSGAYSILTGIAANKSMADGVAVQIADLVPGLAMPDYPAMPDSTEPLPMPSEG